MSVLEWDLRKGENALALFEDYQRNNIAPPEGLLCPEILQGYEQWYEAFWQLSSDRQLFDGGCGPIPFRSIASYPGITFDETDTFVEAIRAMDKLYMDEYHAEAAAAAKGEPRRKHPRKILKL